MFRFINPWFVWGCSVSFEDAAEHSLDAKNALWKGRQRGRHRPDGRIERLMDAIRCFWFELRSDHDLAFLCEGDRRERWLST